MSRPNNRYFPDISGWGVCVCVCVCRLQFKEEMLKKRYEEETGSLAEERAKQEADEHRSLMAWNDAENLRLRKIRWDS